MMITTLSSYVRRAYEQRSLRPFTDAQIQAVSTADREFTEAFRRATATCRTCGKPAQIQLIQEPVPADGESLTLDEMVEARYEFLCYDDLGIFLEVFADPRTKEWTVVRL